MVRGQANASAHVESHKVRRYRDMHGHTIARLLPGDCYATDEDEVLDTVLGSCVAACVRCPRLQMGGMNHFMLPRANGGETDSWNEVGGRATRYGAAAMERLINLILRHGARREELEVKIFGGARVLATVSDIGDHNIKFVREYLAREGLKIAAEDVGDVYPRHVRYFARTGRVRVRHLGTASIRGVGKREEQLLNALDAEPVAGAIDLFTDRS
jgi:chemotaxis protein CheD